MCGIAGISARDGNAVRPALSMMDAAQRHRGPDGGGRFVDALGSVVLGLGHRRLSILDLSTAARQPMVHPDTGDVIVFNGEIYNFRALRRTLEGEGERFTSTGDTEVLLRGLSRHGEVFLDRLEGMFAFAFLHRRTRKLLLARDPMGIKPLYYTKGPGPIVFASEVRAIVRTGLVDPAVDERAVTEFLAFGAFQQPATIFQSIRMLMPGHLAWIDVESMTIESPKQYWRFPDVATTMTAAEASEGLRSLLGAAVRDHLESDVPVGVFLSSGIDSTVIAGLAREHSSRLRSFTVGFDDHADFSEAETAAETASLFGLDHTPISVHSGEAEAAAAEWMDSLDQPSFDGLNVFLISKVVRRHGITVALSGLGGDELFCGYPSFVDVPFFANALSAIRRVPRGVRSRLAPLLTIGRPLSYRQKLRSMLCSDGSLAALYLLRRRVLSDEQLRSLGEEPLLVSAESMLRSPVSEVVRMVPDAIASVSRLEAMLYQGNMLLRDSDTNAMAHGLEIRVPMLDRRVVERVSRIPGAIRFPRGASPKHLLRTSCADLLRPRVLDQPKMGFTLPIRRWMAGPLRGMAEDSIEYLAGTGLLDPQGVRGVWESFARDPETPMWSRAFTLVILGRYLRRMVSSGSTITN